MKNKNIYHTFCLFARDYLWYLPVKDSRPPVLPLREIWGVGVVFRILCGDRHMQALEFFLPIRLRNKKGTECWHIFFFTPAQVTYWGGSNSPPLWGFIKKTSNPGNPFKVLWSEGGIPSQQPEGLSWQPGEISYHHRKLYLWCWKNTPCIKNIGIINFRCFKTFLFKIHGRLLVA